MASDVADQVAMPRGPSAAGLVAMLAPFGAAVVAYFHWQPSGVWATALGAVGATSISVACFLWGVFLRRNILMLSAAGLDEGANDRKPYAALRARLEAGGTPAIVYERWLTEALARVDRFFGDGDPGAASQTFWPRAFGLIHPAPLWTAASFDRCLLLALFYPIAVIFGLWVVTGHQGPAEAALGLAEYPPVWKRAVPFVVLMVCIIASRISAKASKSWRYFDKAWKRWAFLEVLASSFIVITIYFVVKSHVVVVIPNALDIDRCPLAVTDGTNSVRIADQPVPRALTGPDNLIVAVPDGGAKLVLPQVGPDILHRVQFRAVGRQRQQPDIVRQP